MRSNLFVTLAVAGFMLLSGCAGDEKKDPGTTSPTGGNNQNNNTTKPPPMEFSFTAKDSPRAPTDQKLMSLTPGTGSLKKGDNVTFVLKGDATNAGSHNLVVSGPQGSNLTAKVLVTGVSRETAGKKATDVITLPVAGQYKFYCNINASPQGATSHENLGMVVTVTVA